VLAGVSSLECCGHDTVQFFKSFCVLVNPSKLRFQFCDVLVAPHDFANQFLLSLSWAIIHRPTAGFDQGKDGVNKRQSKTGIVRFKPSKDAGNCLESCHLSIHNLHPR